MAVRVSTTLHVSFRHNLRSHIRWFEYMTSNDFTKERKSRYESARNLNSLRNLVRRVVQEEIYSISKGEGNIEESVTAVATGNGNEGGTAVYFDPNVSPAKGTQSSPATPDFSYAIFFDNTDFNSFLLGVGVDVFNPMKHRPFKAPMVEAFNKEAESQAVKALMDSVRMHRPKQPKGYK